MSKSFVVLVASAVLATAPLAAQTAAPAGAAAPAPEEKKICRRNEGSTGSIMMQKKVCRTAAEWKAITEASAQSMRDRPIGVAGNGGASPQ
ncbi:hypothetical protein PQ455_10590 [Sphingomonas naphthae]|uniref:Secreted protein n=1 Tax=Sphingomonas naphthae TaxID=1813468 RepID=A0ABY7TG19_9SPHN|nr:hypothetical protein [Sphingomonas naphthae]WCT72094.1 hypothetical protein PQ455_10590 [Sphingomonas naphthae]